MSRRRRECANQGCSKIPYLGGLCKEHYEEKAEKERRRDGAVNALHTATIADRLPENLELRDELFRLRNWWDRACNAVNYNRRDEVLGDEAEYAIEWCIALAQEIVDAEIAFRAGNRPSSSLGATREWVWDRFRNLESGLMSNGVKRKT